eukprot:g11272.t1
MGAPDSTTPQAAYCSEVPRFRSYLPFPSAGGAKTFLQEESQRIFEQLLKFVYEPERLSGLFVARTQDRRFVDAQTRFLSSSAGGGKGSTNAQHNLVPGTASTFSASSSAAPADFASSDYPTVIGRGDDTGKVIVGTIEPSGTTAAAAVKPTSDNEGIGRRKKKVVVTYFAPSSTAEIANEAMGLLNSVCSKDAEDDHDVHGTTSTKYQKFASGDWELMWGADCEDSCSPEPERFLQGCQNFLRAAYADKMRDHKVRDVDEKPASPAASSGLRDSPNSTTGSSRAKQKHPLRVRPVQRLPGLELPAAGNIFTTSRSGGGVLPLHLVAVCYHLAYLYDRTFLQWHELAADEELPYESILFYIPKMETVEEARYWKNLADKAEQFFEEELGCRPFFDIKFLVVFENPRAFLRMAEIRAALEGREFGGDLENNGGFGHSGGVNPIPSVVIPSANKKIKGSVSLTSVTPLSSAAQTQPSFGTNSPVARSSLGSDRDKCKARRPKSRFAGGSLGWHDFLASTARLFKNEPRYQIPRKSRQDLVITTMRKSHLKVAAVCGNYASAAAGECMDQHSTSCSETYAIGGMYGVLPLHLAPKTTSTREKQRDNGATSVDNLIYSELAAFTGLVKDVFTQRSRGLHGFWIARTDYVFPAFELAELWDRFEDPGADVCLESCLLSLFKQRVQAVLASVRGWAESQGSEAATTILGIHERSSVPPCVKHICGFAHALLITQTEGEGEDPDSPYSQAYDDRVALAAHLPEEKLTREDRTTELRYNVRQSLLYMVEWLLGNCCSPLPAQQVLPGSSLSGGAASSRPGPPPQLATSDAGTSTAAEILVSGNGNGAAGAAASASGTATGNGNGSAANTRSASKASTSSSSSSTFAFAREGGAEGNVKVQVCVLDDLATLERSRWQLWHDVTHGRTSAFEFLQVLYEERDKIFSKAVLPPEDSEGDHLQARREALALAVRVFLQLVLDSESPVEFVTELLLTPALLLARGRKEAAMEEDKHKLNAGGGVGAGKNSQRSVKTKLSKGAGADARDRGRGRKQSAAASSTTDLAAANRSELVLQLYAKERQHRSGSSYHKNQHFWLPDDNVWTEFCAYYELVCPNAHFAFAMAEKQARNEIRTDAECFRAVREFFGSRAGGDSNTNNGHQMFGSRGLATALRNLHDLFDSQHVEGSDAALDQANAHLFRWRRLKLTAESVLRKHPSVPGVSVSLLRPFRAAGSVECTSIASRRGLFGANKGFRCGVAQNVAAGFARVDPTTWSRQTSERAAKGQDQHAASSTKSNAGGGGMARFGCYPSAPSSDVVHGGQAGGRPRRVYGPLDPMGTSKAPATSSFCFRPREREGTTVGGSNGLDEEILSSNLKSPFEQPEGRNAMRPDHILQIASLSKTIAAAMALEHFQRENIDATTTGVNEEFRRVARKRGLLSDTDTELGAAIFQLQTAEAKEGSTPVCFPDIVPGGEENRELAEEVKLCHLMNHTGLGMHYVFGFEKRPRIQDLISDLKGHKYDPSGLLVAKTPGKIFKYSGGGFLVLQLLLEFSYGDQPIGDVLKREWDEPPASSIVACGYRDDGAPVERLFFPELAAGGECCLPELADFLATLCNAFHDVDARGSAPTPPCPSSGFSEPPSSTIFPMSHDTAIQMLFTDNRLDCGAQAFMKSDHGLGVFVTHAGLNKIACHQAANDGFRGLYLLCFQGPDCGKGLVLVSNGDNSAVPFNCELVAELLRIENWSGLLTKDSSAPASGEVQVLLGDHQVAGGGGKNKNEEEVVPQAEIVNRGLKELLFAKLFAPDLPEDNPSYVKQRQKPDPLQQLNLLHASPIAVRSTSSNARFSRCVQIEFVSDQRFARAANLFNAAAVPVFEPTAFGADGKIMDSWETKRHCCLPDGDFVRFRVAESAPGGGGRGAVFDMVYVSTMFHDGNHAPYCDLRMLDASASRAAGLAKRTAHESVFFGATTAATSSGGGGQQQGAGLGEGGAAATSGTGKPLFPLQGHASHWIKLARPVEFNPATTTFEFYNYPDGGISRLGFFSEKELKQKLLSAQPQTVLQSADKHVWADFSALRQWLFPDLGGLNMSPIAGAATAVGSAGEGAQFPQNVNAAAETADSGDREKKIADHRVFRYQFEIGNQQKELADTSAVEAEGKLGCQSPVEMSQATVAQSYQLVRVTNQHYGRAERLLCSDPPLGMHDGFETKRTRDVDGIQEAVFWLERGTGSLAAVEWDFSFFVNNNPVYVELLASADPAPSAFDETCCSRRVLVPKTFAKPYRGNRMRVALKQDPAGVNHGKADELHFIAVRLFPCGGVNRLKLIYSSNEE